MAEKTSGLYRLVTLPWFYEAFQNLLGGARARKRYAGLFFPDLSGKQVLEVGCGPGTWFPHMAGADEYVGVDWNEQHVQNANARHSSTNVRFLCGDVAGELGLPEQHFDMVFAFGLLHHLDDVQAVRLIDASARHLRAGGRFLAVEPVYHERQHPFARWMKDRDSGQNIRTREAYLRLLEGRFAETEAEIHTGALRVPYSHCVLQGRGPQAVLHQADEAGN